MKPSSIPANMRSQYDMWLHDFNRMDHILRALHDAFAQVHNNPEKFHEIVILLNEIWSYLITVVSKNDGDEHVKYMSNEAPEKLKEFMRRAVLEKEKFHRMRQMGAGNAIYKFNLPLYNDLNDFRNDMMTLRQKVGLGLRFHRLPTQDEKDRRLIIDG